MAKKSNINIAVTLGDDRIPESIEWNATDSSAENGLAANAMMVSFWDAAEKTALRIDLWTKDMMVDEMADFYFQTFMGMADSFNRSTGNKVLVHDIRAFAQSFYKKFQEEQQKSQNAEGKFKSAF